MHTHRLIKIVTCTVIALLAPRSFGERVVFGQSSTSIYSLEVFNLNADKRVFGQTLDLTHDAFHQPGIGELPDGPALFLNTSAFLDDGTQLGINTQDSEGTGDAAEPAAGMLSMGSQNFTIGEELNAAGVGAWIPMAGHDDFAGRNGIFANDHSSPVGVEQGKSLHLGLHIFGRDTPLSSNQINLQQRTIVGRGGGSGIRASLVPALGIIMVVLLSLAGISIKLRAH